MGHTSAVSHDQDYYLGYLTTMREQGGPPITPGLPNAILRDFLDADPSLAAAIERAYIAFEALRESASELLAMDEAGQVASVQDGYLNFYAEDHVNPYVALAAQGPWIVTLKGAVIYDCGGYGMLGLGHAPTGVLAAMNRPHVMANVMTPSLSQMALVQALRREIGHSRQDGAGFDRFLCLNSGSEAVTIAARIADINARQMTDPGGRHAGKPIRSASLRGGFHGRTDRPARHSDSCMEQYRQHLASFRDIDPLLTIEPNDIESLESVFREADTEGFFIGTFFMEPVMGEGNPGLSITPAFYRRARELTAEHGTLFLVDSIQAGLRAHGVLSILDYPGFRELAPPDVEVYSKALNAGQFPLSVLALSEGSAALYRKGLYGNTMTSNPRAADVAVEVLAGVTPQLRKNIVARGEQLVTGLEQLAAELPDSITAVQGTGLLFSCELHPRFRASGAGSIEEYLRQQGLGVIHGGENSLRYTPCFEISEAEVALILERTREALMHGPER
jgi:acetylornithine/succinyldiaminopimelate/putrescine aminotransferase